MPLRIASAALLRGNQIGPVVRCALIVAIVFLGGVLPGNQTMAADVTAARSRNLAAACAMCHGTGGVSQGGIPTIAGQSRDFLELGLRDFRDGKRPATIMQQIAKGYSDEEIGALAAYFSMQSARSGMTTNTAAPAR